MSTEAVIGIVITALTAFFGGLAGLVRWGLGSWDKAAKDQREDNKATRDALIENTKSNTALMGTVNVLVSKVDGINTFVRRHTPPAGVPLRAPSAADFTAAHEAPDADGP